MAKPRALVTGASSGIGAAYARRLARDGYDLVLVARRGERLKALAEDLGGDHGTQVEILAADLGDPADVRKVEDRVAGAPTVDLLINNAGFGVNGPIETLDPETMDEMVRVNLMSLQRLTRAAVPGMLARGEGAIINVSSGTAFIPMAESCVYMATKSFILGFTRSLHAAVGARGVQVQALVPGLVETEFFDRDGAGMPVRDRSMIMAADDLVDASLAALRMGEVVCIPSLPDYEAFRRYEAAELGVLMGVSKDHIAERYRT